MASEYRPPTWAGNPKPGLHLDVVKSDSVLQKLLIDEKNYYLFGRNTDSCDFPLQHQSCSRVHAALVHHKHLNRPFLIDLGSAHGTHIGTIRLESHKPQQLLVDSTFRFGASTRSYVLREKPQTVSLVTDDASGEGDIGMLLGLNDLDHEVDDLTQYNTAHNRQISTIGIIEEVPRKRHRRNSSVTFNDQEEIINPEDVDPNIGRFRNMIQTSIIPTKRPRSSDSGRTTPTSPSKTHPFTQPLTSPSTTQLYPDSVLLTSPTGRGPVSLSSSFHTHKITSAPPVENPAHAEDTSNAPSFPSWSVNHEVMEDSDEPKKKKYAKEAWPGKKPAHLLL